MADLNIMCTSTSIKFISFIVLECGRILLRGIEPKIASGQKNSSFDITAASVVTEAIVWPLSYTQLVALTVTTLGL